MVSRIGFWLVPSVVLALCLGAGGCGPRAHIRAGYGKEVRQAKTRQVAWPASTATPLGLDSEEAAIIHASYRKQLGRGSQDETVRSGASILIVEEPKHGQAGRK
jgi:hypothetical protein